MHCTNTDMPSIQPKLLIGEWLKLKLQRIIVKVTHGTKGSAVGVPIACVDRACAIKL